VPLSIRQQTDDALCQLNYVLRGHQTACPAIYSDFPVAIYICGDCSPYVSLIHLILVPLMLTCPVPGFHTRPSRFALSLMPYAPQ